MIVQEPRIEEGRKRALLLTLLLLVLAAAIGLLIRGPLPQDQRYHCFADARRILGIPNFWNVISNLPFVFVGWLGLWRLKQVSPPCRLSWQVFYAAVLVVGFGSSWYHLAPTNQTLVWDRLPMAAGFMALFAAFLAEYLDPRFDRGLFAMVSLGLLSVVIWAVYDDLRLYVLVQFFPLVALVMMLLMLRPFRAEAAVLVPALAAYFLAKALETWDHELNEVTAQAVSGHPLKHLSAALGPYILLRRFRNRGRESAERDGHEIDEEVRKDSGPQAAALRPQNSEE